MTDFPNSRDYARIETAIALLAEPRDTPLPLDAIAAEIGLSPFHFQRLFKRWAGLSPKKFQQYLSVDHAKALLAEPIERDGRGVRFAGLSGPSRSARSVRRVRSDDPRRVQGARGAAGDSLRLRALAVRRVPGLPDGPRDLRPWDSSSAAVSAARAGGARGPDRGTGRSPRSRGTMMRQVRLTTRRRLAHATPGRQAADAGAQGDQLSDQGVGGVAGDSRRGAPRPTRRSARTSTLPRHGRAVGNAVAHNAISWLVPCHRVIRKTGVINHNRWGGGRKRAMLGWEAAQGPPIGDGGRREPAPPPTP